MSVTPDALPAERRSGDRVTAPTETIGYIVRPSPLLTHYSRRQVEASAPPIRGATIVGTRPATSKATPSPIVPLAEALRDARESQDAAAVSIANYVHDQLGDSLAARDLDQQLAHLLILLGRFSATHPAQLDNQSLLRRTLEQQKAFPWPAVLTLFDRFASTLAPSEDELDWTDYGPFLGQYDSARRNQRGVYYTPDGVADFAVAFMQRMLPNGFNELCDSSSQLVMHDPAVGSGAFLLAVLRRLIERQVGTLEPREIAIAAGKLQGVDVLLPAVALAHLRIVELLHRSQVLREDELQLPIRLGDSLKQAPDSQADGPIVFLGNPPFSAISQNRSEWIESAMRDPETGYFHVDGEPLGERKIWLNDDYVKFIRAAQVQVERAGRGGVVFVTSHAMLDNASFRGMRNSLLKTFPRQWVLDLHGNRKRDERAPDGGPDENIFNIEQGIAVCWLDRLTPSPSQRVAYAELFGKRDEKLQVLQSAVNDDSMIPWTELTPIAPHFTLRPTQLCDRFAKGVPLPEIFPVQSTAPVTARDGVVVAFHREELAARLKRFLDLSIPDEQIRRELFPRQSDSLQRPGRRKREYPAGDTRGWNMSAARRQLAETSEVQDNVRTCLYRPFDSRVILWMKEMIDWPRPAVTQHIESGGNLVLLARRLAPPNARGVYLWACDGLALDGVIRSDNRGSESLFPLWLDESTTPKANIAATWIARLEQQTNLQFDEERTGAAHFSPRDMAAYIYAQLQSEAYQQRFRDHLCQEFPRVFAPHDVDAFRALVGMGNQLLELHVTKLDETDGDASSRMDDQSASFVIRAPYPRWRAGRIELEEQVAIEAVDEEDWTFHVGSHQVCRKWWRDRRGRHLSGLDLARFQQILASIRGTRELRSEIPGDVDRQGCWRIPR